MAKGKKAADDLANREERRHVIDEVLSRSDIVQTAKQLGLEISSETTSVPKTLCPFHPDKRPSLSLFRDSGPRRRDNFHCFACGAHGDVISLAREVKNWDFPAALAWLSALVGVELSLSRKNLPLLSGRRLGFRTAEQIYSDQADAEKKRLIAWANSRGLSKNIIEAAGLSAPSSDKLSSRAANDRELVDGLLEAGLVVPLAASGDKATTSQSLFRNEVRDFFRSRILFPLTDELGEIVGYAGRSIGPEEPKYLYTRGFKRSEILYRMDVVRIRVNKLARKRGVAGQKILFHLYVVEGLVDALRLESLDLDAVAVLGSSVTADQAACIGRLAADLERKGHQLVVHLFLDADDAGRRGVVQSIRQLLPLAVAKQFFLTDVISPSADASQSAHDPDELFSAVKNRSEAEVKLKDWGYSVLDSLIAASWNTPLFDLSESWKRRTYAQEVLALRDIELQFSTQEWIRILERLRPNKVWFSERVDEDDQPWAIGFSRFLNAFEETTDTSASPPQLLTAPAPEIEEQIQRAIQLAYSSTQRRELPVDEGSWERIQIAIDTFVPYFRACLNDGIAPAEPFISIEVPKSDGSFRLKAIAAPEELTLQQYMLVDILRDYRESRGFFESIPAVRYSRRHESGDLITTGLESMRPSRTVSFAYQVDMDVVEGIIPPRREGIFRPYYPCWMEFIQFLDNATAKIATSDIVVARLDIKCYYDHLRRTAVNDVLYPSMREALGHLRHSSQSGSLSCASAFVPSATDPETRAQRIVDWLCDQSFGFEYLRSADGRTETSATERGVPQGPDLSAYLANIALFPLDRAIDNAAQELGAVFARYVDDIVIAAPTADALREMRSIIENELERIGLELNPTKSRQYDPMTRDAFRAWLTDRRGGLGVSGPFAGPPLIEPMLLDDPWAMNDAPDRDEALRLLHDADNLCASTDAITDIVRTACRAEELRHNDRVKANLLLWRCVGTEAIHDPAVDIPARFIMLTSLTESTDGDNLEQLVALNEISRGASVLFTWLDSLESLLRLRIERFRELSRSDQETVSLSQKALAQFVCGTNIIDAFQSHIASLVQINHKYRHLLLQKSLQIITNACRLYAHDSKPTLQKLGLENTDLNSPAISRQVISISGYTVSPGLLATAVSHTRRQTRHESRLLFHEAICRLQIANSPSDLQRVGESGLDPLAEMIARVQDRALANRQTSDGVLISVLGYWLPGVLDQVPSVAEPAREQLVARALESFLNIAKDTALELMHKRPSFAAQVLQYSNESVRLIPAPPGMNVPGLLGVKDEETVRRMDLRESASDVVPTDLDWTDTSNSTSTDVTRRLREARLLGRRLVIPRDGEEGSESQKPPRSRVKQLIWLADAFSSLVMCTKGESSCTVTPFNLLAVEESRPPNQLLGYITAQPNSSGDASDNSGISRFSAFIRAGKYSLARVLVPHFYGPLWQVGTALADVLGLSHSSISLDGEDLDTSSTTDGLTVEQLALKLLRVALYRLRGCWDPVTYVANNEDGVPRTVERAIQCLRSFPQDSGSGRPHEAAAAFLRLFAEGKALALRSGSGINRINEPRGGSAAAFLADFAQSFFPIDSQLASTLPRSMVPIEQGLRRPVAAWFGVARRLNALDTAPVGGAVSNASLPALEVGCNILALNYFARSLLLELWSSLSETAIAEVIESSWDNMLMWVGEEWQLVNWQYIDQRNVLDPSHGSGPRGSERNEGFGIEANDGSQYSTMPTNLRSALRLLKRATSVSSTRYWRDLQRVTPLGWFVMLEFTLRAWEADWFQSTQRTAKSGDERRLIDDLRDHCLTLSLSIQSPRSEHANTFRHATDAPWGDLADAIETMRSPFVTAVVQTLGAIESKIGITIKECESPNLSIGQPRAERIEVRVDDGIRHMQSTQIAVGSLQRERNRHGAEFYLRNDDLRPVFIWTEARRRGTLIGVHIVRPSLAEWAGTNSRRGAVVDRATPFESMNNVSTAPPTPAPPTPAPPTPAPPTPAPPTPASPIPASPIPASPIPASPIPASPIPASPIPAPSTPAPAPSDRGGPSNEPNVARARALETLQRLKLIQDDAWMRRRMRPDSHVRVAFVQWEVDDSYRHPFVEVCLKCHDALKETPPEQWTDEVASEHGYQLASCCEYRRRKVLEAVLNACGRFEVDALLLPEYSVRPETVGWLRSKLPQLAPKTWIWAGTFRKPPFLNGRSEFTAELHRDRSFSSAPAWSAIHVLIDPRNDTERRESMKEEKRFKFRRKKYPAIGMGELFAPLNGAIESLYTDYDIRRRITELICSEVFIVTSPSNLTAAGIAYRELAVKFGVHVRNGENWRDVLRDDIRGHLVEDVLNIGERTSVVASPLDRRSVVFVPAMTSRAADYAVLGQSGFLASGLTTVFCNAVDDPHGTGRSCFVGHDGWGKDKNSHVAMPEPGPYHGVLPGIFHPSESPDRGCLGKREQAMVIADVDTQFATEGAPRPQLLPPPLRLVAHLPIMETWKRSESAGAACRCRRHNEIDFRKAEHVEWIRLMAEALQQSTVRMRSGPMRSAPTTIDHPKRRMLSNVLQRLPNVFSNSKEWMQRRADRFSVEHAANPQSWPPPVAVDWIVVHLGAPENDEIPKIEVPPYVRLEDEIR